MNTHLNYGSHQPRFSVRLDARLDAITRAKSEELVASFQKSRVAVLRQVMGWGSVVGRR